MTSKTAVPKPVAPAARRIDFAEFGAHLAARRAELGNPELSRNSGKRRTSSKLALLEAIKDAGGCW